jgi:murein DD-endopeptidase MepM/ murein hydrolase activator NlpD
MYFPTNFPLKNLTTYPTVSSQFGKRRSAVLGMDEHFGVDFSVDMNTPIYFMYDEEVIKTGYDDTYGNVVETKDEVGRHWIYGHLSSVEVQVGKKYKKGDKIGNSGTSGLSTGPHLHIGRSII